MPSPSWILYYRAYRTNGYRGFAQPIILGTSTRSFSIFSSSVTLLLAGVFGVVFGKLGGS